MRVGELSDHPRKVAGDIIALHSVHMVLLQDAGLREPDLHTADTPHQSKGGFTLPRKL